MFFQADYQASNYNCDISSNSIFVKFDISSISASEILYNCLGKSDLNQIILQNHCYVNNYNNLVAMSVIIISNFL